MEACDGVIAPISRIVHFRWLILGALTAASIVVAGGRGDWNVFVEAGKSMMGTDGLAVFITHREVQTGPLTLAVAGFFSHTPRNGFVLASIVSGALGLGVVALIEQSIRRRKPRTLPPGLITLTAGPVIVFAWAKLGGYGHLDDALIVAAAVYVSSTSKRESWWIVAALGLAIGFKPWSVVFLPLAIEVGKSSWRRYRLAMCALAVGGFCWLPFVLADPATLDSIRPTVSIASDSVMRLLLPHASEPTAVFRILQLAGAASIALIAVQSGRREGAMMAALAVRIATDPGTWPYYTAGLLVAAAIWDVALVRRVRLPMTMVVSVGLLPQWLLPDATLRAASRGIVATIVLVAVFATSATVGNRPRSVLQADEFDPESALVP